MNSSEHLNNIFKRKKKRKLAEVEEIKKSPRYSQCLPLPREENYQQSNSVIPVRKMLPPDFRMPYYPNE